MDINSPKKYGSIDELKAAIEDIEMVFKEIDPHHEAAHEFAKKHFNKIVDTIMNNEEFWQFLLDNFEENVTYQSKIEIDSFIISVKVQFGSQRGNFINISIYEKTWHKNRIETVNKLFGTPNSGELTENREYKIDALSQRLDIKPSNKLPDLTQDVNVEEIVDRLALGLDERIAELIHLLNGIGFLTDSSCGGHPEEGRKPYINFRGTQIMQVIGLFRAWQEAGGIPYTLLPLGDLAEVISIQSHPDIPMEESVTDIDKFTDFLNAQTGGFNDHQLSPIEIGNRIRRQQEALLKDKG